MRLALLDTYDGELASARERAEAALAEGAADPALRVVLHRRFALILLLLVELLAGRAARGGRAARWRATLGQPGGVAQARASLAFLRALRGDPDAGEALERMAGARRVAGQATIDDSPPAIRAAADVRRRPRRRAGTASRRAPPTRPSAATSRASRACCSARRSSSAARAASPRRRGSRSAGSRPRRRPGSG